MTERLSAVLDGLPVGGLLDDATWRRRHRLLLLVLAAHLPALLVVALATGHALRNVVGELAVLAALAAAGAVARGRLVRAVAVTLGLVASSAVLVHLSGGLIEAHFHYFIALGLIALYQDWRPYVLAVVFVVVGHGYLGATEPASMFNHPAALARPWLWAGVHGAAVLAACAAHVGFWRLHEREQRQSRAYYRELYEGECALARELRQAERVRSELIAVVSHEFRTPLTSILGFAQTLTARYDALDRETALACTDAIARQAQRLDRIVRNLLAGSGDVPVEATAAADLAAAAGSAVDAVAAVEPDLAADIRVDVPTGLGVGMSADAAVEVCTNLLDNAVKFAEAGTPVTLRAARREEDVVFDVVNVGPPIRPADRDRIFEAFVQVDSSDTRRYGGVGLGLHVVRRLVEAHHGSVQVASAPPLVVFTVTLPAAAEVPSPAPRPVSSPA
jgi:signal transduction histidine kinase